MVGSALGETQQELAWLKSIYDPLRPYTDFFQISFKRIGNQTLKRYDTAKTPYQRVLERKGISLESKAQLTLLSRQLNAADLWRQSDQKTAMLWNISRYRFLLMHCV